MSITGSNNIFACNPVVFANTNSIISLGTITRDGNQFTFSVGFVWKINGVTYQNTAPVVITIAEASEGFNRIDNALLNTSNTIELQQGLQSETIALKPIAPDTNIILTSWNISGNTIGDIEDPIIGTSFVKKSFSAHFAFNGSGVDTSIPLNPNGYSEIRVTNPALESIAGVDLSLISGNPSAEVPYTGKIYLLKNITGNTLTIKHNSEIADIPFYTNDEQNLEVPNKGSVIFTYDNAACEILLTNFSVGTANNLPYTEITKTELDTLIANSELTKGFYKISGVNTTLYGGTTILVEVLEDNKLPIDAYGLFYNPKYDKTIDGYGVAKDYAIWKDESEQLESGVYAIGDNLIWGGKHWNCIAATDINTKYIVDKFNLSTDYFEEIPFNDTDYNLVLDKIKYDYEHDLIIERNEKNSNIVSFSYDSLTVLSSILNGDFALDNPIKSFQWGNLFDFDLQKGIGNNKVYDSINENINFKGAYQVDLNFDTIGQQTNLIFSNTSYQIGLTFSNYCYQNALIFGSNSYQNILTFKNQSNQSYLRFGSNCSQNFLNFYLSGQYNLVLNDDLGQYNLVFNEYQRSGITISESESNLTFYGNQHATKITGNQFFTGKTTNDFAQIGDINNKADLVDGKVPAAQSQPSTMVMNNSTYVITFTDATGAIQTIDLPLESLFQDANYDETTKSLIVTLQDGTTRTIPLSDLVDLPEIVLATTNPAVTPTTGQKVYFNTSLGKVWFNVSGTWTYAGNLISDSEKVNIRTAYNHSQVTGNPHGTTATDVDALKRDGSNANSDVNLGNNNLNAKGVKINGTAGSGHLGLKHQSTNATAGGQETALFAGSDGELYYKNDSNELAQIASRTWVNANFASKFFSHKLTTPTAYVTGTVSETEVYRLTIPANTLSASDAIKIPLMLIKKLGTNGTVQVRGKMSTSPTMPTGTTDLIFQTPVATAGNQTLGIIKTFFIDNGNIKGTAFTNASYTDNGAQAGTISEKVFDVTVTNYLYISVINGSASDQTRLEAFQLTNS